MDVLEQMEREGLFEKVRIGDHRAAGLFARLAAYRMNPTGDRSSFGWLRKGGGANVEGYSEDAIVYGDTPSDLSNVVDIVAGAGAPGARIGWMHQPRRSSDVWEQPKPLTAEQMAYLGGAPPPGQSPTPDPGPSVPADIYYEQMGRVVSALLVVTKQLAALDSRLAGLDERLDDEWAARVWTATDPEASTPSPAPTYEGRVFGQRITLRPVQP
jgi:hypothetical protein